MRLGVNIDHVATVRQARRVAEPEPIAAALLAELGGAHGITVHLRGDRRHIQERDVELLRQTVSTRLNVEMAATREMVAIAAQIRPHQVTLVPERANELTTTGGLDVVRRQAALKTAVAALHKADVGVSLFVDPTVAHIKRAASLGVMAIEINTGAYAEAPISQREAELDRIATAAMTAEQLGLQVLAGHGLTYVNVLPIAGMSVIRELNIGHSIVARAVLVGMERAVREMVDLISGGR